MNPPPQSPQNGLVRIRQGKAPNVFKRFWQEGHDPLKPYIEEKDEEGNVTRKQPEGKSFNVCEMCDDELDDFLGEEERQALERARMYAKESKGRNMCKEIQEAKEQEEKKRKERLEVLEKREQVWVEYSKQQEQEFADYKKRTDTRLEKMASLLAQLMAKP